MIFLINLIKATINFKRKGYNRSSNEITLFSEL